MAFEFNLYVVFAVYVVLNSSEMTKSAMNPSYWQTYSHFSRHKHILFKIKHFLGGLSFSGAFVLFLFGRQLAHALVLLAVFFEHSKFLFLFFNVCVFFFQLSDSPKTAIKSVILFTFFSSHHHHLHSRCCVSAASTECSWRLRFWNPDRASISKKFNDRHQTVGIILLLCDTKYPDTHKKSIVCRKIAIGSFILATFLFGVRLSIGFEATQNVLCNK